MTCGSVRSQACENPRRLLHDVSHRFRTPPIAPSINLYAALMEISSASLGSPAIPIAVAFGKANSLSRNAAKLVTGEPVIGRAGQIGHLVSREDAQVHMNVDDIREAR